MRNTPGSRTQWRAIVEIRGAEDAEITIPFNRLTPDMASAMSQVELIMQSEREPWRIIKIEQIKMEVT